VADSAAFDQWAASYDFDLQHIPDNGYPFAGYFQTLAFIRQQVTQAGTGRTILDIGIGTGLLTKDLYSSGFRITGLDFSAAMLEQARRKMPAARLICADLRDNLPQRLAGEQYDFIVSSYTLHHLPDTEKVELLADLLPSLTPGGVILVGDISFPDAAQRGAVRSRSPDWDDEEFYFAADELQAALAARSIQSDYTQLSVCSGVLQLPAGSAVGCR